MAKVRVPVVVPFKMVMVWVVPKSIPVKSAAVSPVPDSATFTVWSPITADAAVAVRVIDVVAASVPVVVLMVRFTAGATGVPVVVTPELQSLFFLLKILKVYPVPLVRLVITWGDELPRYTTIPPSNTVFEPSVKLLLLWVYEVPDGTAPVKADAVGLATIMMSSKHVAGLVQATLTWALPAVVLSDVALAGPRFIVNALLCTPVIAGLLANTRILYPEPVGVFAGIVTLIVPELALLTEEPIMVPPNVPLLLDNSTE
jgi:hypothetical protein